MKEICGIFLTTSRRKVKQRDVRVVAIPVGILRKYKCRIIAGARVLVSSSDTTVQTASIFAAVPYKSVLMYKTRSITCRKQTMVSV